MSARTPQLMPCPFRGGAGWARSRSGDPFRGAGSGDALRAGRLPTWPPNPSLGGVLHHSRLPSRWSSADTQALCLPVKVNATAGEARAQRRCAPLASPPPRRNQRSCGLATWEPRETRGVCVASSTQQSGRPQPPGPCSHSDRNLLEVQKDVPRARPQEPSSLLPRVTSCTGHHLMGKITTEGKEEMGESRVPSFQLFLRHKLKGAGAGRTCVPRREIKTVVKKINNKIK